MIHYNSRAKEQPSQRGTGTNSSIMRRTSVPSLRNQNNHNQQPRSTTTITHSTNRNRPSTQTAQYVQGQQDFLPSTPLGDTGNKTKEPCLYFRRGTVIEVITRDAVSGWWHGQYENLRGWFPSHFVGRVSHLDTSMGSNDATQKELNAWKATMIDQQKNRISSTGGSGNGVGGISGIYKKNSNLVSPSNDNLVKGSPLKNRYSANPTTSRQSMTPSTTSNVRPASRTSSLMQQNKTESHSATRTTSPIRKSRVPLPSPPSSTCSSMIIDSNSTNNRPKSLSIKAPLDWESQMDEVSKHMFDLVDACASPASSSLHVRIHQTTSSIRALLSSVPTTSSITKNQHHHPSSLSSIEEDMLADQRKTVLQVLSKVVHKGSELQLTGCTEDARFRALVNQLWVEIVAFEEIIRTTFKESSVLNANSTNSTTSTVSATNRKRRPLHIQHLSNLNFNPSISTSIQSRNENKNVKNTANPTTPPNSPPREPVTPRSSTNELDQLACGLLDHQTQIIDLINTHIPYSNDLGRKDQNYKSICNAQNAVFDAITQLIQVIRESNDVPLASTPCLATTVEQQNNTPFVSSGKQPKQNHNDVTFVDSANSSQTKESNSLLMPLSPLSPQQLEFNRLDQQNTATSSKNQSTSTILGPHRSSAPILSSSNQFKDTTPVNKHSSISVGSFDAHSSNLSLCTSMTSMQSSIRLSQSFEQLERSSTSNSLLRKSSDLFRSNRNTSSINNVSSISSTGSILSDDSTQYHYDPSLSNAPPATPTVSISASHKKLPRVTTLSNLAMRYLTSSSSTSTSILPQRQSQNLHMQQQHQQQQQNAMPPPPSPAASYTTTHSSIPFANNSPPLPPNRDTRLLNSKSTPAFDQIKMSTSQSLRNMGVASLRNISRKPRRLSNQNRKSDSVVLPTSTSTTMTATSNSFLPSSGPTASSTTNVSSPVDPPLRMRISSSLRLRRSIDNNEQREKAAQEQKQREQEEEEEKRNRPWYLKKLENNLQTAFNADGHLVGASLQALIEIMTCHEDSPDQLFLRSFFYNFRLFTDPETLARILMDRFNLEPPVHPDTEEPLTTEEQELWESDVHVPVQLRVYNVIKDWFEAYFDIGQDKKAAQLLLSFAKTDMEAAMSMPAKRMTELIELKLMTPTTAELETQKSSAESTYPLDHHQTHDSNVSISVSVAAAPLPSSTASTPIRNAFRRALNSHHHHHNQPSFSTHPQQHRHHHHDNHHHNETGSHLSSVSIHRMDPQEIANQLTLMESTLFCQIPPSELMAAQKKKSAPAMHVKAMVHQSTLLVYWISNTILGETDAKIRVMVIKFWIKVADACLQLNNYNTLMTIRCALNSASIARLRRTWDSVMRSTKYKTMYHTIDCVADSEKNFAMYRKCLKNATTPGLPFLGIFLSDMVFIDEGNTDHRTSTGLPSTITTTATNSNDSCANHMTPTTTSSSYHQQQQQNSAHNTVIINFDKYMRMTQMLDQTITRFQQVPYYKLKEVKEIQRYLLECIEAGNDSNEELIYSRSLEIEPRIVEEVC